MTAVLRWSRRLVATGLAVAAVVLASSTPASAHPLGNFTVNRYTAILVSPDGFEVEHVLDLAEIPTAQLGDRIQDLPALATSECTTVGRGLDLRAANQPVALALGSARASTKPGQGGLPITRVTCRFHGAAGPGAAARDVRFVDRSSPGVIGWSEVTAVGDRMTITDSDVPAKSVSDRLESYPRDLLTSPLDVRSASLTVRPGGPAAALPGTAADAHAATTGGWLSGKATDLLGENGWWAALLALAFAVALGATHALAPGHGKTVMAFYLGQRRDSSWRAAVSVGTAVTAAHTGSVLVLGVLVTASTRIVPVRLYPWLTLATGLLVVGLGLSLLRQARRGGHTHGPGSGHTHPHPHDHSHDHSHSHDHGHPHAHGPSSAVAVLAEPVVAPPGAQPAPGRRAGLWAMGLVGGLVPSPSALLLLLAAIAIGRAWFGVLLVVFFGLGMAVTLAVVGLVARDAVRRLEQLAVRRGFLGGPLRAFLSFGAATSVCVIGAMVVIRTASGMV